MPNAFAERLLDQAGRQIEIKDYAGADPLVGQALGMDPKNSRGLAFGAVLAAVSSQNDRALGLIKTALKQGSHNAVVMRYAAEVFFRCGQQQRACRLWEQLLEMHPCSVETLWNLAQYHYTRHDFGEAETYFRKAMELEPDAHGIHSNLGTVAKDTGRIEEAVSLFREGMRRYPQDTVQSSNYLLALHYDPSFGPEQIHAEHRAWGQALEGAIAGRTVHGNDRTPTRRLRVGYVSPDFRAHAVGYNLLPLLRKHDHAQFEIHCYSDTRKADEMTEQIRQQADVWHDTTGLSDDQLADLVTGEQIDVLVDLVMHTNGGVRLGMFARNPAPVQVAWMAYPGSTGLSRMSYRLTDPVLDPPDTTDHLYSEQSIRLESFWCFEPPADCPPVGPLPADKNGYITFGCLNSFCKVNGALLELWREVLAAVPESRLAVLPPDRKAKAWALEKLQIRPERLVSLPRESRVKYFGYYNRVDLALDPFPYTGHTTTLDGLWMGVAPVSLTGPTVVSRGSLSILSNVGLGDLVVKSKGEYVALAVKLSRDQARLRELREGLRGRMERSVLMDTDRFARKAEAAYRTLWLKWCELSQGDPGCSRPIH